MPLDKNVSHPQELDVLAHSMHSQGIAQKDFTYRYYAPWFRNTLQHTKEEASWANRAYGVKNRYYGENLQLISDEEIDTLLSSTHFEAFSSVTAHAIMIKNAHMRSLPSDKPFFKKTTLPGEGYPFDYLQTSRIHIAEPVLISHYSKDGAWAFVESSFASGWVPSDAFVTLNAKERMAFIKASKIAITFDNAPLYNNKQRFITYAKIGAVLPFESEDADFYHAYAFTHDGTYAAKKITLLIPKMYASSLPLVFNEKSVSALANAFLGEKYGWGGSLDNRDCSAMTRDFLAPFGVWIPRNSAAQKNFGEYLSLKELSPQEKETMILKNGIAFLSLIYLKGHIMLYAGEQNGRAMVLHNTWGVKTLENGKEGRHVIGKAIVSDLYIGNDQDNVPKDTLLINRVESMLVTPKNTLTNNFVLKYPSITALKGNTLFFADGSTLPYDDKKEKSFDEKLENADTEDHFFQSYPAFAPINAPILNDDPGRFRNDALLKKLYGSTKAEIEKNLTPVIWLPSHGGKKIYFNKKQNAAAQLQKVSNELDALPSEYLKFLIHVNGTYAYRNIAGTSRLSSHSYGTAVDLDTRYSRYWRWDKTYHYSNEIPKAIVDIFEKHGFIWGGRWYHYDTMHFEYRPEMFESID